VNKAITEKEKGNESKPPLPHKQQQQHFDLATSQPCPTKKEPNRLCYVNAEGKQRRLWGDSKMATQYRTELDLNADTLDPIGTYYHPSALQIRKREFEDYY
jgi:hypothetical protein